MYIVSANFKKHSTNPLKLRNPGFLGECFVLIGRFRLFFCCFDLQIINNKKKIIKGSQLGAWQWH